MNLKLQTTTKLIISLPENSTVLRYGIADYLSLPDADAHIKYGEINSWNVGNVTNMDDLFNPSQSAVEETTKGVFANLPSNFNLDVSNWNVSNVRYMNRTFYNQTSFNQPLSSWNVSNVKSMEKMFSGCVSFDQDLGNWDISGIEEGDSFTEMFKSCTLSTINYSSLLRGWSILSLHKGETAIRNDGNITFHGGFSKYSADVIGVATQCL